MKPFQSMQSAGLMAAAMLTMPHAAQAQNAPLDGLVKTAVQWAALSDASQNDKMWDASGVIMQKSIPKADWAKYLTNLHNELGPLQGRDWTQVTRVVNPAGLPPGEYVNVLFSSRFAKSQAIVEKVSLTQFNGKWTPVGYIVNKIEPPSTNANAAAAPATGNKLNK